MEETIDPGTGLPIGSQPTPVGAYDFTAGLQSMQSLLDKIGEGQANRAAQQAKDKSEFDELTVTKPVVWSYDDAYIQEALDEYDKALNAAGKISYDPDDWTPDVKKDIAKKKSELERRKAEAIANEKYYNEAHDTINKGDNKTYDTGWFNQWSGEYLGDTSAAGAKARIKKRLSGESDDNPYQRPYTIFDVVDKYKEFHTYESGGKRYTDADRDAIEKRIIEGSTSGVGRRMYELNRLTPNETVAEFAKRVADMAPDMLRDSETRLRQGRTAKEDDGFNVQGFKWDEAKLTGDENAAQNVDVNALYAVRKGMGDLTITVGSGNLQWTYKISHITRSNNGAGGYDYWIHGERNGVPLSKPHKMDQQDIGALNAKTQWPLIEAFEEADRKHAKQKWKSNEASNLPGGIGEPTKEDIVK